MPKAELPEPPRLPKSVTWYSGEAARGTSNKRADNPAVKKTSIKFRETRRIEVSHINCGKEIDQSILGNSMCGKWKTHEGIYPKCSTK
jgi:hypothetical protein